MGDTRRATPAPNSAPGADRAQVARWLDVVDFAIENGPERLHLDALLELAESLETVLVVADLAEPVP